MNTLRQANVRQQPIHESRFFCHLDWLYITLRAAAVQSGEDLQDYRLVGLTGPVWMNLCTRTAGNTLRTRGEPVLK